MSSSPPLVVADRYRLVAPLGQGGMGRVWRATDVVLHRDVAIKELVPPPGLTPGERQEMRERSLREARAIARLNNINVVRVFDVLRTDADPWIVMEYVPSRSLQDTLATDGPFPPVRAAEIGLGVLGALRAAHRAGVVHRDVKPGNVLLGADGRVVLTDFGLATVPGDPNVTRTGLVLGSPAYIAPERARDGTAGPAADLWSLGATLYAAVEGASPFARPSAIATLAALATENPPPARNAGPLKPVLNGLLRKDPAHRINAEEAERLLNRAAGRKSRVTFPMSPTMRRPGIGRERPALTSPTGSAPVVPGPRPPVVPARPVDPPGRPPASGGRPAAGGGRPPVYVPGKAQVGRPADKPTRVDGPKVDRPRLDATRVDTPPVRDDRFGTRAGSPPASGQPPATPPTRGSGVQGRGAQGAYAAPPDAAPRGRRPLPPPTDPTARINRGGGPTADPTTVVGGPPVDATAVVSPLVRPVTDKPSASGATSDRTAPDETAPREGVAERAATNKAATNKAAMATPAGNDAPDRAAADYGAETGSARGRTATAATRSTGSGADEAVIDKGSRAPAEAASTPTQRSDMTSSGGASGVVGTGPDSGSGASDDPAVSDAGPAAESPATDEATPDRASATDGSATDGSATDGSATDGSATDRSATDGSASDGAGTDRSGRDGVTPAPASVTDESPEAGAKDATGGGGAARPAADEQRTNGRTSRKRRSAAPKAAAGAAGGVTGAASTDKSPGSPESVSGHSAGTGSATDAGSGSATDAGSLTTGAGNATAGAGNAVRGAGNGAAGGGNATAGSRSAASGARNAAQAAGNAADGKAGAAGQPKSAFGTAPNNSDKTEVAGGARGGGEEGTQAEVPLHRPASDPAAGGDVTLGPETPVRGAAAGSGAATPDDIASISPLSPLGRSTRPAWRPMEPRPLPRGVTVFGTRLTYRQAAIGAGIVLLVLVLVATLVAGALGDDEQEPGGTKPGAVPTAAGGRQPSAAAPGAGPGGAGTAPTTAASTAPTPTAPTPSAAPTTTAAPGAVALPAGWKWFTGRATGDSPAFMLPIPQNASGGSGGQEIQFNWNNRMLLFGRTKSPQADAYDDWKRQEAERRGSYRNYDLVRIERVQYRNYESVADWEYFYTTGNGNRLHVIRRNIRVDGNAAYSINFYVPVEDWNAAQKDLQLLYQGFQPK